MAGDDRNDSDYISRRAGRYFVRYGSGRAAVVTQQDTLLAGGRLRNRISFHSAGHGLVLVPPDLDPFGSGSAFSRPTAGTKLTHRADRIFTLRSLVLRRDYPGRDHERDSRSVQCRSGLGDE